MGKARKAQTAGDLWHLSIDDLLKPPGESPEPGESGPFVINLSTSAATIPAPPARMPRFEGLRLYQVQQAHDEGEHRVLFRLRLGIIHSALEADAILASVREYYPGATLESATDDDETAVAEATVTQPVIESSAAGVAAQPAQSKRTSAAPPSSATAPGTMPARDASAGAQREPAPKAPANLLPDIPLEPVREIRWDIDDLLPDLPVTRPSQPNRTANERGRKGHSHARKAPAAPLPPSASSPTPPASTAPEIAPPELSSSAPAMPMAPLIAETELPVIAAAVPEALPPEVSLPASAEPAPPSAAEAPTATDAEENLNVDFDSNADTVEVEALVMIEATSEGLDAEPVASALENVVADEPPAPAAASVDDAVFELEYLDPTSLGLPAPTAAPVPTALAAGDTEEHAGPALSDSELTQEVFFEMDSPPSADRMASADSVTVEAPALWDDASMAARIVSAGRDLSPDSVTVEALALDVRTPAWAENPWALNEADADADSDAQAMEALAAKISAQSGGETVAASAVESVSQQPEPSAPEPEAKALAAEAPPARDGETPSDVDAALSQENDSLSDSQTLEEVVARLDARSAEATLAAAPVRKEDSQTLEVLVAKIGALVESAEARDNSESALPAEAVLAEPLVHVEPLAVVEWEPVRIADTPAAETLEAQVASSLNATTARMRVLPREQSSWPAATDAATPASPPASTPAQWPIAPTAKVTPQPVPMTLRSPSPEAAPDAETPAFDSTQTIRALTPLELQNGQASKSYAIQLVLSEEPIHPEQIPNLDIFDAYRLYVVTGFFEERVMHALRLGFFTSEVAAEAVAGYLKGYFDVPCIKRVSLAEHDRFQERRVAARKDVGATGRHAAIELTSRPDLPERRAKVQETTAGKQSASSSIWSRLVSPLKR